MDRDDFALTEALGQNEFKMRLDADMGLVCVPDLGWRRVLVRWQHVRGLHQPRYQGEALLNGAVGLWSSPTMRLVLPVVFDLGQVEPFSTD